MGAVLCLTRELVHDLLGEQRFLLFSHEFSHLLDRAHHHWVERTQAEEDSSFKQVIPYAVLLRATGDPSGLEVFVYQRRGGEEGRLEGLWSLGVGGHIEEFDGDYWQAFERELAEEVVIEGEHRHQILGLVHDESTPVGRVHVGVVHLVWIQAGGTVRAREACLAGGRFLSRSCLSDQDREWESWSRILIEQFFHQGGRG